jgi:hypothetical protein
VARVRPGKSGTRRKKKTAPDTDRERFRSAGASAAVVLHAVLDRTFGDLNEIHRFQDEHRRAANAVLFEGAPVTRPLRGELSVYVVRPLKVGASLARRRSRGWTCRPTSRSLLASTPGQGT